MDANYIIGVRPLGMRSFSDLHVYVHIILAIEFHDSPSPRIAIVFSMSSVVYLTTIRSSGPFSRILYTS